MGALRDEQRRIARWVQGNIPPTRRPFRTIARREGMTERAVLGAIREMAASGVIRKFGAILRHQRAGYTTNVLILWEASPGRIDEAGRILATFPEITHCYEREPAFAGRYNLFCMAHLREGDTQALLRKLVRATGLTDPCVLSSVEEFKKSSMEYFA